MNKRPSPSTQRQRWNHSTMMTTMAMLLWYCCYSCFSSPSPVFVQAYTVLTPQTISTPRSTLEMKTYKPPVQNSVQKLHSSRKGGSSSTSSSRGSSFASSSQRKASVATHHTSSSSSTTTSPRSFEDRMRGVLGRQERQQTASSHLTLPSNVHMVHTLEEYKEVVGNEHERMVVVGFFASEWCKACQAAVPWFYKLAQHFPSLKFVHVPVTAQNVNLHQGLGVERLPSGHLYHPTEGLIQDDLRMTKKRLAGSQSDISQLLQWYVQGSCELNGVGDARDPRELVSASSSRPRRGP